MHLMMQGRFSPVLADTRRMTSFPWISVPRGLQCVIEFFPIYSNARRGGLRVQLFQFEPLPTPLKHPATFV